jgi:hypothetical protein
MRSHFAVAASALLVLFAVVMLCLWYLARSTRRLAPTFVDKDDGDRRVVFVVQPNSARDSELDASELHDSELHDSELDTLKLGENDEFRAYSDTGPWNWENPKQRLQQLPPPKPSGALHFRMPLRFKDGVPMVSLRIKGQPSKFVGVADTGSHHLNVNADTCKSCDRTYGSFVTTAALHAQPTVWLRYGTQHDAAKIVRNAGVQLHVGGPAMPADVHVTVDRVMAASNFNVVGLLRRGPKSRTAFGLSSFSAGFVSNQEPDLIARNTETNAAETSSEFLSQILPPTSALYIRMYGASKHQRLQGRGFVAGVREHAVHALRRNATVRTSLLPSLAAVGSYIVALTAVRIGGRPLDGAPKFLLIDTGSNMTSFSRDVFRDMLPALLRGATLTLEIDRQSVDIPASAYMHTPEDRPRRKKMRFAQTHGPHFQYEGPQYEGPQYEGQQSCYKGDQSCYKGLRSQYERPIYKRHRYAKNAQGAQGEGKEEEEREGEGEEGQEGKGSQTTEPTYTRNVFRSAPDPNAANRLMIDDDLRILNDSPLYAIWGAHAMRGHNLVFTGDDELLLTPAVPHPDTGLVADDAALYD